MEVADIHDLIQEQWLRKRNKGEIVWKTKTGNEIPINEMTDSHLENTINYLIKRKAINDILVENEVSIF